MRRTLAVLLTLTLVASGCATAPAANRRSSRPPDVPGPDRVMLSTYLKRLPIGARVRASLVGGKTVRGTLMNAADEGIVVQQQTRIPEPPIDIPIGQISSVEIDSAGGTGRAIGIGVASGAGAALAVFLILVAMLSD